MPRPKAVSSLKHSCLVNIARNMDKVWCSDFERDFGKVPRLLYVLGPFENFTGEMIQELINVLVEEHKLRRQHFQLLLTSRVEQLDLSHCPNFANVPHLIGVRCWKLTSLNLSNCSWINSTYICSIVENLPLLKILLLRNSKINDSVFAAINQYCHNLNFLDVFACPVTDAGAISLCNKTPNSSHLRNNLRKLDISATKIGNVGAVEIIKTFPNLIFLGYADIIEVVSIASGEGGCTSKEDEHELSCQIFQLRMVTATGLKCKDVTPQSVSTACRVCPFITEVIFYQGAKNDSLQNLRCLKHLKSLEITSDQPDDVTFFDGLVPLLKEIGQSLTSLGVFDVKDLDLGKLGVLCPLLESLKCVMAAFNSVAFYESYLCSQESKMIYSHLAKLMIIIGNDGTNFSAKNFECLLLNAEQLALIHLVNVQCMTSELMFHIIEKHGWKNLLKVYMESCDQITISGIHGLLICNNPLDLLILKHCRQISKHNFELFTSFAQQQNYNLTIEWA